MHFYFSFSFVRMFHSMPRASVKHSSWAMTSPSMTTSDSRDHYIKAFWCNWLVGKLLLKFVHGELYRVVCDLFQSKLKWRYLVRTTMWFVPSSNHCNNLLSIYASSKRLVLLVSEYTPTSNWKKCAHQLVLWHNQRRGGEG